MNNEELLNKLNELKLMLETNQKVDWDVANVTEGFEYLTEEVESIIKMIEQ